MIFEKTALFCERLFRILKTMLKALLMSSLTKPERLRLFFEESGGVFLKLGQILALRRDLLSVEYTMELLKLLNNIPIEPFHKMNKVFMEEIGEPVDNFFSSFDYDPIGSASIAQVYKAVLKNGDNVAVKIQRPGIKEVFETDFLIISFLASVVDLLSFFSALSAKELVDDLIRWTRKELDFRNESNNAVVFLKYRQEASATVIPKQYQEYAHPRVLIQEFIQGGISVLDVVLGKYSRKQLIDKGINLDQMALCLLKEGMKEYFIDGFFHADPHPANLALLPGDKESPDGKLVLFDFGIVGEAEKENRLILLRFVYSISVKNIEMMAKYLMEYGKKNLRKEIDRYFQVERGKQKIVDEIMAKIEGIIISHFKEDIQEIAESWFSVEEDSDADFKSRSSATFFLSMVQKADKYGVHFPLDIILFFRGLVIDDMVALQMSPQFDIMKAMEGFFTEHPVEEVEEKIRNQTNWQEIDKKIVSVNDDWESFIESSMWYKEKAMIVREKTLEMVFYYAERYPEIKGLISKL